MKTATELFTEQNGGMTAEEMVKNDFTVTATYAVALSNENARNALDELTKRFKGIKELNITPTGANKLLDAIEQLKSELK